MKTEAELREWARRMCSYGQCDNPDLMCERDALIEGYRQGARDAERDAEAKLVRMRITAKLATDAAAAERVKALEDALNAAKKQPWNLLLSLEHMLTQARKGL